MRHNMTYIIAPQSFGALPGGGGGRSAVHAAVYATIGGKAKNTVANNATKTG
jgi:hypothetical protein